MVYDSRTLGPKPSLGPGPTAAWRKAMRRISVAAIAMLLALGTRTLAQEHPEHPKQDKKAQPAPDKQISLDSLAEAIARYIEHDSKLKGGYFLVYDAEEKKPLALQLQKVHRERLATLGGGVYFACTDMKATDGTVYDLDFFTKQTEQGLETTEIAIHKKSGKPRYNWKEEGGVWKKTKI
jgi:hypothetical protein